MNRKLNRRELLFVGMMLFGLFFWGWELDFPGFCGSRSRDQLLGSPHWLFNLGGWTATTGSDRHWDD